MCGFVVIVEWVGRGVVWGVFFIVSVCIVYVYCFVIIRVKECVISKVYFVFLVFVVLLLV